MPWRTPSTWRLNENPPLPKDSLMRTFLVWAIVFAIAAHAGAGDKKIRVVLIDGQNNHQWPLTTPIMKKALEASGKFTVDISTSPKRNQEKLIPANWES